LSIVQPIFASRELCEYTCQIHVSEIWSAGRVIYSSQQASHARACTVYLSFSDSFTRRGVARGQAGMWKETVQCHLAVSHSLYALRFYGASAVDKRTHVAEPAVLSSFAHGVAYLTNFKALPGFGDLDTFQIFPRVCRG
jgi:hypothetical protein